MGLDNLKPNTDEYLNKQSKYIEDLDPAVDHEGHLEKKSSFTKLIEMATGREIRNLKQHILYKVLLPWLFNSIHDGFEGVNDAVFGRGSSPSKKSYSSYWDSRNSEKKSGGYREYSNLNTTSDYRNPILDTREEALDVKERLIRLFEEDHVAGITIANLYRVARINHDTANWTLMNYGWNSLNDIEQAYIERKYTSEGTKYILVLPRPKKLNTI